ncbi:DEAD/DEAH box helicase [Paenibacillus gansuensis]|uniref:DEAD/DEAH box helicase n=1 Tax=Paenibacillus gansuensis TaxID=306542 RepID=A0ABW5P892_9BACL
MNFYTKHITLHAKLTDQGDALLWGSSEDGSAVHGQYFTQLLFAWDEATFYGTSLEQKQVQDVYVTLLPAERVLPFFADPKLLGSVQWGWDGEAARLAGAAPPLMRLMDAGQHIPSYERFVQGQLAWTWDEEQLTAEERLLLEQAEQEDAGFTGALQSAFSAAVSERHYGSEAASADLRREFPALFQGRGTGAGLAMARGKNEVNGAESPDAVSGTAGGPASQSLSADAVRSTARDWLAAIGWREDTAPFRPLLRLLEPDEEAPDWRLQLVLQDKLDAAALYPIRLQADGTAAGAWPGAWTAHVRERAAGWLERLRAYLPAAAASAAEGGALFAEPLSDDAAWRFLTADSRMLIAAGWQVLLPAWWEAVSKKKPRLRARVSGSTGRGGSLFGLNAIVDFDWRIAIGEADLSEAEFAELVARNSRLVLFRGQWIQLDPALLTQMRRMMSGVDKAQGLTFQDVLQLHLLGGAGGDADEADGAAREEHLRLEVELSEHFAKLIAQLGQASEWAKVPVPAGLRAELRPYQRDGFAWLAFLRQFGLGACLADDMGLGKTVQYIAYLLHMKEAAALPISVVSGDNEQALPAVRASLLICPTSVLGNWQKEIARFAPDLNILLHYGAKRENSEDLLASCAHADIVLTSYATALLDQDTLQRVTWNSICLDEAQNIKNPQSKQSLAVRSLHSAHRVALTGTPIENRLSELWAIYDFTNPGYLGNQRAFQHRFANAIEKQQDQRKTEELQKLVKPFMLRRKKKDPNIQLDLPDKQEMKVYINLTAEQGAMYEQTVTELMEKMQKLEGIERKGAILSALTRLKQLCGHPVLLTKEPLSEAAGTSPEPLFNEAFIERSAKLERLLAMVKELREEGDKCLIFTQYIGMGGIIKRVLEQELDEPVQYLNGSTPKAERDRMIERFQSQEEGQPGVFILSLKAGGVGLNLTAANHVFHFDRWWNPAVENQATDRAYRMGQTRDVQVHKFISLGTLEEKIDEMLESKMALSENVISTSEGWITELSNNELQDLFALRQEWLG